MTKIFALSFVALHCGATFSLAQATPKGLTSPQLQVIEAQRQRFAAMTKPDRATLQTRLADELVYTHSNAKIDSKSTLMSALLTGKLKYRKISPSEITIRAIGDCFLATGQAHLEVQSGDNNLSFAVRFTEVWVKRANRWQLAAWQSTRIVL